MSPGVRPKIEVVAAFIEREGRVLLDRRRPGGELGGLWEFPGGKLEPGESPVEALRRELREELGVEAAQVRAPALATVEHAYPAFDLVLSLYAVELGGTPRAVDVAELAWHPKAALPELPMPAANRPLIAQLAGLDPQERPDEPPGGP